MDFDRMLQYCAQLEAHNERPWFHENHKQYEAARKDYLELLEITRFAIAESAPQLANDILYGQAKDWMYRIARDMRYHHNQPPYNPAFRAYISPDRKSWLPIGYFLRISHGSSYFGTGLWCESTADTNRIRDYIQEYFEEFDGLLQECPISLSGEQLKTMPKGYSADHPAAHLVKYKYWEIIHPIPDSDLTTFADFDQMIRTITAQMEPVRLFLLKAARSKPSQKQIYQTFYRL
ncbi:MAG: DUF2461 domain-containing protein [Oscillospiraceae bacterium]|nr:DUF2461 domain-containing protein [Oscillospiraceae bacterium]